MSISISPGRKILLFYMNKDIKLPLQLSCLLADNFTRMRQVKMEENTNLFFSIDVFIAFWKKW